MRPKKTTWIYRVLRFFIDLFFPKLRLVGREQLPDEPERGDVIILWGKRYEVLAPNNEPVWRWSGPDNLVRRIHTKEIGDE